MNYITKKLDFSNQTLEEMSLNSKNFYNLIKKRRSVRDFKNDEVLFSAFSEGGHSLVEDVDYISAATATSLVLEGGIGSLARLRLFRIIPFPGLIYSACASV